MATADAWGIEIGANAIKALHLIGDKKTGLVVANYEVIPFKSVLTAPDVNAEEAIQVNLDQLVNRHDMSRSIVVLSVPGHMAFARFAKLPPVDPKKIPDIVRFEAQQQIPFPIEQVEWDYQVFQQEDSPDVEVGIFAITKDRVMQFLANVRAVKIQPDALTLSPLAVYNAMAYDLELDKDPTGTIFMDIGTTSTDVIIVESGRIWLRTLPIGGNNFTEALVRAFNLSFPKAEKLKREASTSKYARQIFQAMRPVFADLVQEMQRSIGYFQSLNRDAKIDRLVGLGSTFRLPGLQKFLKQQLQIEVTRPDGFKRLSVEGRMEADFAQHAMNMATAYGLALQGLGLERVGANILPTHLIKQRIWKSKQPWVIGAAAMIAIASGLAWFNYSLNRRAAATAQQQYGSQISAILDNAQGHVNQIKEVKGEDRRAKIENLRRILDYRDVWPKLLHDISMAFKAAEPQLALVATPPEYDKILAIPREERRDIQIESITAEYQFVWDAADAEQKRDVAVGIDMNQIWRRRAPTPGAPGEPGMGPMGPGGEFGPGGPGGMGWRPGMFRPQLTEEEKKAVEATAQKPPTFKITVVGTTPFRDASKLLGHYIFKWLQDQPQEPTRPYRIVVVPESMEELVWLLDSAAAETRGRTGGGAQDFGGPGAAFTRPGPAPTGGRFGAGAEGGFAFPGASAGQPSQQQIDLGPLIPERPGIDEARNRDWRFKLTFVVQLKAPDEARAAFHGRLPEAAVVPAAAPAEQPAGEQPPAEQPAAPDAAPAPPADQPQPAPQPEPAAPPAPPAPAASTVRTEVNS